MLLIVTWNHLLFLPRSACDISNGIDNQVPSSSVIQNTFCVEAVNGDSTPSPNHVAARPKNTPVPKPLEAQPVNSTGKNGSYGNVFHEAFLSSCISSWATFSLKFFLEFKSTERMWLEFITLCVHFRNCFCSRSILKYI